MSNEFREVYIGSKKNQIQSFSWEKFKISPKFQRVSEVACAALIIHAEDDDTINIDLAGKLFKAAKDGGKNDIDMITVDGSYGLGHNDIFKYHKLPDVLRNYCKI